MLWRPRPILRLQRTLVCLLCLLTLAALRPRAGGAQEAPRAPAGSGSPSHPIPVFRHLANSAVRVLLSPDGKTLVTLELDGAKYWDAATGKLVRMRPWSPTPGPSQTSYPQNLPSPYFWKAGRLYWYEIEHGTLYCGDLLTNARVRAWPAAEEYGFASDGTRLIRFGRTRHAPAIVLDPISGKRLGRFVPPTFPSDTLPNTPVYFSPNGFLAAMVVGAQGIIWDIRTGARVQVLTDPRKYRYTHGLLTPVVFSPDGKSVVTGGENVNWMGPGDGPHSEASYIHSTCLLAWDLRSGKPTCIRENPWNFGAESPSSAPAFSADGKWLFEGSNRWEMPALKVDRSGAQGAWLACGGTTALRVEGSRKNFAVWDLSADKARWTLPDPPTEIKVCAFSPDGLSLATGDSRIRLWDLRTLQLTQEWTPPFAPDHLSFLPDGRLLNDSRASASSALIDPATGRITDQFPVRDRAFAAEGGYQAVAHLSPDGKTVVEQNDRNFKKGPLLIKDVATGEVRHTLPGFVGDLHGSLFTPDSLRYVVRRQKEGVTTSRGAVAVVLNLATGQEERVLEHEDGVYPLAVSADGRTLIAGSSRGTNVFDMTTGRMKYALKNGYGLTAAFSPTGQVLALTAGHPISLLAGEPLQPVRTMELPIGQAGSFSFAPNGRRLACTDGGVVEIWQVPEGRLLLTLRVFPNPVEAAGRAPHASLGSYEGPAAWIAYTPEGYYTGSANIADYLYWRKGTTIYPAAHFPQLFRPDLCLKALQAP